MINRAVAILSLMAVVPACAPKSAPLPAVVPVTARLQAAASRLDEGCLDCLLEAFHDYAALRSEPGMAGAAALDGAIRAAIVIALREQELGLVSSGHLAAVHAFGESTDADLRALIDAADALTSDPVPFQRISRERARWTEIARGRVPEDRAATYLWLRLTCPGPATSTDDRAAALGDASATPLLAFKLAADCDRQRDRLRDVLVRVPRFREVSYYLGLVALSGIRSDGSYGPPDLETADARFGEAYEWRQDWPALTVTIGNVAMTAEDFARAVDYYDRTLALVPDHGDALLGRIRALIYLGRYEPALEASDRLLRTDRSPGEARYWRALAESRLGRDDDAWVDIELAKATLINADVPKLAGIIAIKRGQPAVAREHLELSLSRRATDCETRFYLQAVFAGARDWDLAAQASAETAACFDTEEDTLRMEVDRLRASDLPPARRDRQVAQRVAQIDANARMRATAWFNAAAANFNLQRADEARRFAEKALATPAFSERAREILDRLAPR